MRKRSDTAIDRRRWLLASAALLALGTRPASAKKTGLELADLKKRLPIICRHEGVWEGVYRRYDAAGKALGDHRSRVVIRLREDPQGGAELLQQSNYYYHADGRTEVIETLGSFDGERLNFYSDRVDGWTMDDSTDPQRNTVILAMVFKKDVGWYTKGCRRVRIDQYFERRQASLAHVATSAQRRGPDPYLDRRAFANRRLA